MGIGPSVHAQPAGSTPRTLDAADPVADEFADAVGSVEQSLALLVRRVRTSWKEAAASIHEDLQPMGYKILSALVHAGATQPGTLAESLAVDKSVMSRQVRVLESLGLVVAHPDPSDGRARILEPTPRAVEHISSLRSAYREDLHERLSGFTPAELRLFADLLRRL
jgi:DNA-binding MarR family transcriptional regulator